MTVNNKYENGQKVYFLNSQKQCRCEEITCVNVFAHADGTTSITYSTKSESCISENDVFASEGDVKDYVFNGLIDFE